MLIVLLSVVPELPVSTPIAVTAEAAVKINATTKTLYKGDTYTLKITGTTKKASWKSSNKTVAVVNTAGKVTAKKKGTATITGTIGTKKYTCKVTVKNGFVKFRNTTVSVNVGKTVTVWVDTKNVTKLSMSKSNDTAQFSWGSWKNSARAVKIKGIAPGTTTLVVYNTNEKSMKSTLKITVKKTVTNEYGNVTGNVTYHYNQYLGYVPDTGAKVLLIPKNGNAKGSNFSYADFLVLSTSLSKKNIYTAEVDGAGNYTINHIPAGQYVAVIISKNTTSEEWFNASDTDAFYAQRARSFKNVLNDNSSLQLSKAISMYQWHFGTVVIYKGENAVFSYAFGYTYI